MRTNTRTKTSSNLLWNILAPFGMTLGFIFPFVLVVANVMLGAMSVNYILDIVFGKTLPWLGAAIIGLFFAEVSVPLAFLFWIVTALGVHHPWVH